MENLLSGLYCVLGFQFLHEAMAAEKPGMWILVTDNIELVL